MRLTRRRPGRESGQATLQYVGSIALAAIIVVSMIFGVRPVAFAGIGVQAICMVQAAVPGGSGGGVCAALSGPDVDQPGGEDQPWYCDLLGVGCDDGTGTGSGGGGGGGGSWGDDEDDPWYCQLLGLGCPDGSGNGNGNGNGNGQQGPQADVPPGLDPDSDLVRTLQSTARGRETLQWLADHDIPIVTKDNQQGAVWNGQSIVLGPGFDNAAVIVHETNHAKYTDAGKHADPYRMERQAYVDAAIAEEVDGTVQQILAAKEFRDAGSDLGTQPGEDAYDSAYSAAKAGGASDADAQKAGTKAVSDQFYNGPIVTSNTTELYSDYYGHIWDSVH